MLHFCRFNARGLCIAPQSPKAAEAQLELMSAFKTHESLTRWLDEHVSRNAYIDVDEDEQLIPELDRKFDSYIKQLRIELHTKHNLSYVDEFTLRFNIDVYKDASFHPHRLLLSQIVNRSFNPKYDRVSS